MRIFMIQAAQEALKNRVEAITGNIYLDLISKYPKIDLYKFLWGFQLIQNFLNTDNVHQLEGIILNVLKDRMSNVDTLDLTKEEQTELR